MSVYQSHNVSLFLSSRSDSVTECITEENKVAVYQSHKVSLFLSFRVPTV